MIKYRINLSFFGERVSPLSIFVRRTLYIIEKERSLYLHVRRRETGETIISDSTNVNYNSFWFYKRERARRR